MKGVPAGGREVRWVRAVEGAAEAAPEGVPDCPVLRTAAVLVATWRTLLEGSETDCAAALTL